MDDDDRHAAIAHTFRLVHDIQAGLPGAPGALAEHRSKAREVGWDDVERACIFGDAVTCWITGEGDPSVAVDDLIERSTHAGDDVMLALGLALRSDQGFSGGDLSGTAIYDEGLARATVLLEQAEGRPCERVSAHTACAIALGNRWLFELSHDHYDAALRIGSAQPKGSLDFLLAPIRFNLAEEQVSWASKLYELGDEAGVRERFELWNEVVRATEAYPISESWQVELDALGLVLRGLAGGDAVDGASKLLAVLGDARTGGGSGGRAAGLLQLAVAVGLCARRESRGEDHDSGAAIEAAVAAISPVVHPFMHDLALFLAAELEARPGAGAGLRYARRVVQEQWAKRDESLMAMRAQIASVRLASERDLLSRHARLDDLTGIANRRALEEFLSELIRHGVDRCALILFDVDAFKAVNDLHGHLAGDRLLVRIAEVLGRGIRSTDLAVRLGGDEFCVILAASDPGAARTRAEALVAAFDHERLEEIAPGLRPRMSAGVAVGDPATIMEMWAAADGALYEAKAAGGHEVRVAPVAFSPP